VAIKDYYVILGVPRTASGPSIRAAYRDLAKERHPDVVGAGGDEAFREINEAYEILSHPARRRAHDEDLRRAEPGAPVGRGSPLAREPAPDPLRRGAIRPSIQDLLEHWLGSLVGPPTRREALHLEVVMSADEARRGGSLPVGVPVWRVCPECGGTGRRRAFPCPRCGRRGRVREREEVRVRIPARVQHGTVLDVGLDDLGIRDRFLRLHVSVE